MPASGPADTLADASPALQEAMLQLHTMAPMRLSQAALPVLLQNGKGGIINVSSVASFLYSAGNVNYCATKAYLNTFSEGLGGRARRHRGQGSGALSRLHPLGISPADGSRCPRIAPAHVALRR